MTTWLPASTRIAHYQDRAARDYLRARMQRNARNRFSNGIFAGQAAIDASRSRALLFDLLDRKLPKDYTGELKLG